MYKQDVPRIAHCFDMVPVPTLELVVDFVLATIQQQFHTVPAILSSWDEFEKNPNLKPPTLWGMKRQGWGYIREHRHRLTALVQHEVRQRDPVGVIDTLLEIPGLNTVKAGFCAQLLGLEVGCIDTHNAELYGVQLSDYVVRPEASARLRLIRIESYVDLCQRLGGAESLWDRWCDFIAIKYPEHFEDAEAVSALHTTCTIDR